MSVAVAKPWDERVETDGYWRQRYRGAQGRRGNPGRAREERDDLKCAITELMAARQMLAAVPPGLTPRERRTAEDAALAKVELAVRFVDAVLARRGRPSP